MLVLVVLFIQFAHFNEEWWNRNSVFAIFKIVW